MKASAAVLGCALCFGLVTVAGAQDARVVRQVGAHYFSYPDATTPWFDQMHIHGIGWITMPNEAEIDALVQEYEPELNDSELRSGMQPKSSLFFSRRPIFHVEPNDESYYADVPVEYTYVNDGSPSRAWQGVIGGGSGNVDTGNGYPFRDEQDQLNALKCSNHCSRRWGGVAASCALLGAAIGERRGGRYASAGCGLGSYAGLQACLNGC